MRQEPSPGRIIYKGIHSHTQSYTHTEAYSNMSTSSKFKIPKVVIKYIKLQNYGRQCHIWPYVFPNLQITRSDIRPHKVGCQPGDCVWSFYSSSEVCVGMYGLTYSLYHPPRVGKKGESVIKQGSGKKLQGQRMNHTWYFIVSTTVTHRRGFTATTPTMLALRSPWVFFTYYGKRKT